MKRLLFLLVRNKELNIPISQYVNFSLRLNNERIDFNIDNHFIFNNKQYSAPKISKFDLEGVWKTPQVQKFVEKEFNKEFSYVKEKQQAKTNLLYDLQWQLKPNADIEYMLNDIIDIVTDQDCFPINEKSSLIIDTDTEGNVDFHIKTNNKIFPSNNLATLMFLQKEINENPEKMIKQIDEVQRNINFEHLNQTTIFNALKKKYLPKNEQNFEM